MPDIKKAIIVGAGPSGLATALRLQKNHIQCNVFEIRPKLATIGGAIGIPSNGLRLLDRLGVYEAMIKRGSSSTRFLLHSTSDTILGEMDWAKYSKQHTNYGYLRIKRADIIEVLLEAVQKQNIPVNFSKCIVKIEETNDDVTVFFSDGTQDTADIVIGCDGIHSAIRKLYVDPGKEPKYSGFATCFSILSKSQISPDFVPPEGINATFTPEGLFALMPCSAEGDEFYWFFSREAPVPESGDSRDGWEVRRKEEVTNFKAILLRILEDVKGQWGDLLREVVNQTEVVQFYPVFNLPLGSPWYKGRCVLVGDAVHAMAPHAQQGISMAMEDIFCLARVLESAQFSLSEAFEKYYQVRRPRIDQISKKSSSASEQRRRTGPWTLWLKENFAAAALKVYNGLGLEKWGIGEDYLLYDIDQEKID